MKKTFAVVMLGSILAGCAIPRGAVDSPESGWWYKAFSKYNQGYSYSESDREELIRILNENANDPSLDRGLRTREVMTIFNRIIRPGFSSADCRKVMGQAKWLDVMDVRSQGGMGGQIPVGWPVPSGSLVFIMRVFPDGKGWSDSVIVFTLSGLKPQELSSEERGKKPLDFLKGNLADSRVRLEEFALCCPEESIRKIIRFTPRGVGLDIGP